MKRLLVFIAACSSAPAPAPRNVPPPPPAPDAAVVAPDAAPPAPLGRGAACRGQCDGTLLCGPLPGGYCMSFCGVTGTECDGTCVETARAGEVCLKHCESDADCRTNEGYVCEEHACTLPNFAAIVPKTCKGTGARDVAFGASELWSNASSPAMYHFEPSAALLPDGGVVAMYITRGSQFEGNALGVSSSTRPEQLIITPPKQSHFDPWLARDRAGTVHAVWYGFDGRDQNGEIAYATTKDGITWSEPKAVHDAADCKDADGGECLDKPMIAIGPDVKVKAKDVVYIMYSAADAGLRVRAMHDGALGSTVTATDGIYGTAAVSADGHLHIATLDGGPKGAFGSADQKVEYTVSADGGASFSPSITVSGPGEMIPFFFSNPAIAVDDARHWIYIAYARGGRDAVWDIVIAASKDGGKTWKRTSIGDGCAIHMVPNVAVDPRTGTLHVVYYDSEGAPRFAHATCTPGASKCTVKGAINTLPFATLSTERHGSKWIGEYESLIVDAKRRVLHAVWAQPVDENGKPIARIFHATAKL